MSGHFVGNLDVRLVKDQKEPLWMLLSVFGWMDDQHGLIQAEVGFLTDLLSIPRIIGVYDELGDRARMAAVIHDWTYDKKLFPREVCDQILREMLKVDGYTDIQAEEAYLAVRAAGGSHY